MSELLDERALNGWELQKFEIEEKDIVALFRGIAPGKYIRLLHNNECVMSDTDMEKRTNYEFCSNAHGDILIGGLGIGMIIMAIQDNPKVNSITVIEKSKEVIEMVATQLNFNAKVKIICADVFEWKPENGIKYDMVYMDIWNWINSDIYKSEMKPLKRKYERFIRGENPEKFNRCWAEYQAKNNEKLI